jgi:hypothetical protein
MNAMMWFRGGLALSVLLLAGSARADLLGGLGKWHGTGTRFDPEGRASGDFKVELVRTADGTASVKTKGTVVFENGQIIPFEQRWTRSGSGFLSESPGGKGSGGCLGADLCYSHEDRGAGKTSTVTVMIDGPKRIRILVTDMESGQPVQFVRETLVQD